MHSKKFFSSSNNRIILKHVNAIIIGAGPSGLSAATTLRDHGKTVLILEKEAVAGGKCHTFSDPLNSANKTEWGAALLAPNYGKVIDKIREKKLSFESVLPEDMTTIPLTTTLEQMGIFEKGIFNIHFSNEMKNFFYHAKKYQYLRDTNQDLPEEYKASFAEFSQKHNLEKIKEFSYMLIPAFGYGLMEKCPAYAVLEYFGCLTLPQLILPRAIGSRGLVSIKNGFQSLMEAIASDFDIKFNTKIEFINRSEQGITINFQSDNQLYSISADSLILAISPLHWSKLGMELTEIEQRCINNLTYYQYPVAVVKLYGYPAKQYFEYSGLVEEGLGHLALITTRDDRQNPIDGRLCSVYINLQESKINDPTNFEFTPEKINQLELELMRVPGVTGVKVLKTKVWQDYMSTLPWDTRLDLNKKQMDSYTKTLYTGSYTLGGFEDVACVWDQADKAVRKYILNQKYPYDFSFYNEFHRNIFFFSASKEAPFNDATLSDTNNNMGI